MEQMNLDNTQFTELFKKEFKFKDEKVTFKKLYECLEEKKVLSILYYIPIYI